MVQGGNCGYQMCACRSSSKRSWVLIWVTLCTNCIYAKSTSLYLIFGTEHRRKDTLDRKEVKLPKGCLVAQSAICACA